MDTPLWQTVLGTLAALGGGGVIIFGFSGLLGKIWTDRIAEQLRASNTTALERVKTEFLREVESYKVKLKKSEFLFQKEFEATSAFSALLQAIHPGFNNPMMDSYDAYNEIAANFGRIEIRLSDFLATYGAVLTDEEREILTSAISEAGYGKFDVMGGEISAETNEGAGKLYTNLKALGTLLIGRARDQSSL
jgi:hypothetical protein